MTSIEQRLLEKSLREITETDTGQVKGIFNFSPDFPAFEGHFPGRPVLPAVVQIAAVRLLAARHLGTDLFPVHLDRAKFKTMVGPDEPMTVTISLDRSNKDVTISFTIATAKGRAATGEIHCRS